MPDTLYVVTVVFNPMAYKSRYTLYEDFKRYIAASGAELFTVELAIGDAPFEVTKENDPMNLQLRTEQILWHKENLINLGVQRLPKGWKYMAWIDADITFTSPNWVSETIKMLRTKSMIQMFTHAYDLNKDHEVFQTHIGFCFAYSKSLFIDPQLTIAHEGVKGKGHPGYAWAATKECLDSIGGLYDIAILGSGDNHMAFGTIGKADLTLYNGMSEGYRSSIFTWQKRYLANCTTPGYLNTCLMHHWHGAKKNRGYDTRWKILKDNHYNPSMDIIRNSDGLIQLDGKSQMKNQIVDYFRSRNEDE